MFAKITGSLSRQSKALEMLKSLMEEEFSCLTSNQVDKITSIEFSIHELIRQLADEKENLIAALGGGKVMDFAQMRSEEERLEIARLYKAVDDGEQICAKQATLNTEVSLALLRQSDELLKSLTDSITPKEPKGYGRKGGYTSSNRPDAMLISGRL